MGVRRWVCIALGLPLVVALVFVVGVLRAGADEGAPTTVYLVRHAETSSATPSTTDPRLSELGMARAAELRDLLAAARIEAVFATPYQRTAQTAGPTAGAAGLTTITYEPTMPPGRDALIAAHPGGAVLIVGHSNTVPEIATHLGGVGGFAIDEHDHGNLIVLVLSGDRTETRHHRYGPLTGGRPLAVQGGAGAGRAERDNVSGVTTLGDGLVICSDEGTGIQVLAATGGGYVAQPPALLPTSKRKVTELDLEDLASTPRHLFAVGSHSLRRQAARSRDGSGDAETYAGNRERLTNVKHKDGDRRDRLFRIPLDADGRPLTDEAASLDLRPLFEADPFLGRAANVPGKENGLDVEGLAIDGASAGRGGSSGTGDLIVLGLRGPVLRGGWTPIVRLRTDAAFTEVTEFDVSFLDLGGLGIRGLARCAGGFLVLAGPVGDAPGPYRLLHWDGADMLPGTRPQSDARREPGRATLLGSVPRPAGAKPEGVELLSETATDFTVVLVFDGARDGAPTELRVRKPSGL